jgi:hypothetical protein
VVRFLILAALVGAGLPLIFDGTAGAVNPPGPGLVVVSPGAVMQGSTGNTLSFSYTPQTKGFSDGRFSVQVPKGWSSPTKKYPGTPGYVSASAGKLSISGQTVTVENLTLCKTCALVLAYSDATAPAQQKAARFLSKAAKAGQPLELLSSVPIVAVGGPPTIAPSIIDVFPGSGQLEVEYTPVIAYPSASDYLVTCGGSSTQSTDSELATVTGLTNAVTVECTVEAQNLLGDGPSSAPVAGTPTAGPLEAPTINEVTPGDGQLTVNFNPVTATPPVSDYVVTCGPDSVTT